MGRCCVVGCKNSKRKSSKDKNKEIVSLHNIPKDARRSTWLDFAKITENITKCYKICSAHFKKENFERDLKAELLNLPKKTLLKPDGSNNSIFTAFIICLILFIIIIQYSYAHDIQ